MSEEARGIGYPGVRVTGSGELADIGTGNQSEPS